jgi:hypothetical protein
MILPEGESDEFMEWKKKCKPGAIAELDLGLAFFLERNTLSLASGKIKAFQSLVLMGFLNLNVNLLIPGKQLNANLRVRALAKPMARVFILAQTTTPQNRVAL